MKLSPPTQPINFAPTLLQHKAWGYLMDTTTNVVLFGGSAGCGKSYLACVYATIMCLQYPGVVGGLTRARIIDLKKSTFITLMNVFGTFGLKTGVNYEYNGETNIITFYNGSKILIFDSFTYPSDPEFERISSTEMTFCIIDEASQISQKAYNIIQTRIRYRHSQYNLVPKLLVVTNPTLNFIKSTIYEPFMAGTLPNHVQCVFGLVSDNPYVDQSYTDMLKTLTGAVQARLLYGDWNYASSDDSIFDPDKLVNVFYNSTFANPTHTKYITCDPASTGADKTCITIWDGWECIDIQLLDHKTIPQIHLQILGLMAAHHVSINNVIVDKVGVGTGLYDLLPGCRGFIANEKPKLPMYSMLKDEIYYKFADMVNNDKIKISSVKYRDEIVQELGAHVQYNYDKDNTKTQVLPKEKVKASIGRSPDIADALTMRCVFDLKQTGFGFTIIQ